MAAGSGEDLERRVGDLLDRVPGYRGYRAKEDRRDADRRVREHVATAFAAQAERVDRVARDLAAQRRIMDVGPVDEFSRTLRHLIDRVRTATYGYGGLMGDRDVDEGALDQLRQFDEGLLSGVQELDQPIRELEGALASGGDLAAPARAGTSAVRTILARLDLRSQVVETGKPAPRDSILRVLELPSGEPRAPVYDLHEGDALAILGDDFLVDSRIEVDAGDSSFRLFRLTGGTTEQWLLAPKQAGGTLALMSPVEGPPPGSGETMIAGTAYAAQATGSGDSQVIGVGGKSERRGLQFTLLAGVNDPALRGVVLDWGGEHLVLAGKEVHPDDVEIFGRPSPRIN